MTSTPADGSTPALRGRRVVLCNWRDPWHHRAGGSERYAWEFAIALRDAGADVEFLTARDRGQSHAADHDGIRVRRVGATYTFYAAALLRLLGTRLRGRAPDLVVDMDCGIPVFTPAVLSRRTPVVVVVHHVHQDQFLLTMRRPVADLGRLLERRVMPWAYRRSTTVAVSDSTVAEMRERLGWRGDVRVLHNGNDPAPEAAAGTGLDPAPHRVVVLGRVVAHKRVDLVVRALAEVRRRRPGVTLDVVGTGDELARLRDTVAELRLDEPVTLHGFLPEAEKSRVLSQAVLHVSASDAEGWGQVVLEAAAHGVPTLARDVPGLRDSIRDGETGWLLAEPADGQAPGPEASGADLVARLAEGIVTALDQLSDPVARGRIVEQCRAWAAEFSWERMRREAVDTVTAALEGRH